jgi:hypothetical protein
VRRYSSPSKGDDQLKLERISTDADFERCLAESAERPVLLLKHSTT